MFKWFPGIDRRIRLLSKRIFFNRYPQGFLETNWSEIRQSLVAHYSLCILISLITYILPSTRTFQGEHLILLQASRITLIVLSLIFLWRHARKKDWVPKKLEFYKVWTSSTLLISFFPFLYSDKIHYDVYLHQASAILLSMNLLLWLTTTTAVATNLVFCVMFLGVCYLGDSPIEAMEEFPILLTYLFVGTFGNVIMNYWRTMDYRDKRKLSGAVLRLKAKNLHIRMISNLDDLTDLYNRRYLIEQFDIFKKRARRHKFQMALVILDLDHLKEINDKYGHMTGDEALQTLSAVMKSRVRSTDICARIGGDEFCVLLDSVDPKSLKTLCESLRKGVESHPLSVRNSEGKPVNITVSIGAAILSYDEDFTFDDLYQSIDSGLYKSKAAGRNRVTIVEATKLDTKVALSASWPEEVRIYK
ncbi:GGDEF domain-containing protein [Leptospira sarikeiensis]|uniref:diguanylate cyclase n=1 Tax=Leptospira sarikeiensis TaxID=2484943 RepID=A0A4R9KBF4_9LEPT|nr:GGDEF domain-containing protein [Leptospira sarikeiensis]TGL64054.1 GGDEF domain-containing protein [Leptospira sarikeiensis]